MPKGLTADLFPRGKVLDVRVLGRTLDVRAQGRTIGETDQLYSMTLGAGQPMGLLLALTYPENIDIVSPKSP